MFRSGHELLDPTGLMHCRVRSMDKGNVRLFVCLIDCLFVCLFVCVFVLFSLFCVSVSMCLCLCVGALPSP